MPIGKGTVRVFNDRIGKGQKLFPIPREKDNTDDILDKVLRVESGNAHIKGKKAKSGVFDPYDTLGGKGQADTQTAPPQSGGAA